MRIFLIILHFNFNNFLDISMKFILIICKFPNLHFKINIKYRLKKVKVVIKIEKL